MAYYHEAMKRGLESRLVPPFFTCIGKMKVLMMVVMIVAIVITMVVIVILMVAIVMAIILVTIVSLLSVSFSICYFFNLISGWV